MSKFYIVRKLYIKLCIVKKLYIKLYIVRELYIKLYIIIIEVYTLDSLISISLFPLLIQYFNVSYSQNKVRDQKQYSINFYSDVIPGGKFDLKIH